MNNNHAIRLAGSLAKAISRPDGSGARRLQKSSIQIQTPASQEIESDTRPAVLVLACEKRFRDLRVARLRLLKGKQTQDEIRRPGREKELS